ncbi:restriction endonuclease [Halobellus captivus]|uniref:restriction endonuclease n=1 Tax=Halobellus captivus TaxID=2592614 RepID=UPI0011A2FECA|nr:restriction endonuclease [Halobellus captivus]
MIPELEPREFVAFLADLWDERGWKTSVRERADESYFVIGKRGDGKRGVIYVFPTATATVTDRHLKQFVGFCRKRGIDVAVVATQGAFAPEAERTAAQRSVHLLDRAALADTVAAGGLEDVLGRYTQAGPLESVAERLVALGLPLPESILDRVGDVDEAFASVRAKLGGGDDNGGADGGRSAAGGGDQGDADQGDSGHPDEESRLPLAGSPIAALRGLSTKSIPAVVLPVILVIAFVLGATVGPGVGIGAPLDVGSGDGIDASAVSTAGANATLDVRWNARTVDSLEVNGTTYDAPEGETLVLVRMNVTNTNESPTQFDQPSLSVEVAGERYGHQPLQGVTGFPRAGLYEPQENREVWTVFSVPADSESVTLLTSSAEGVRFTRDRSIAPEATVPDDGA